MIVSSVKVKHYHPTTMNLSAKKLEETCLGIFNSRCMAVTAIAIAVKWFTEKSWAHSDLEVSAFASVTSLSLPALHSEL